MTTQKIIEACAQAWGVTPADVMGRCRKEKMAEPRHYARWLMYHRCLMTTLEIADIWGCTHPTVLNSINRVWEWNSSGHYEQRRKSEIADAILKGDENE